MNKPIDNRFLRIFAILILAIGAAVALPSSLRAQITGVKTIPGDYVSFAAAVSALNAQGVGFGGVTFKIAAGYNEAVANAVLTIPNNPPDFTRPLVFQKDGVGSNPILTATMGISTIMDGIVVLHGVDYVTFDGIDLSENPTVNTNATRRMEWGYAFIKTSPSNGCQHNTIKNCTVSMIQNYEKATCVYLGNNNILNLSALVLTSFAGTHSYNGFYNNTLKDCSNGYQFIGYASPEPYDLYDRGNEIGVDGISTRRNQIIRFGGNATNGDGKGIYLINQSDVKIAHTFLDNTGGLTTAGDVNMIYAGEAANANVEIHHDTITNNTLSNITVGPIFCDAGNEGAGNTISIHHNIITNCKSGYGIILSANASYCNIYNNTITNISSSASFKGIQHTSANGITLIKNIYGNQISGNTLSGGNGYAYGINISGNARETSCYNNLIFNNFGPAITGGFTGIQVSNSAEQENIYNNIIYNLTCGTGDLIGIRTSSGGGAMNKMIEDNLIHDLSGTGQVGGISMSQNLNIQVRRNNIYHLTTTTADFQITPAAFGISVAPTSSSDYVSHISNNFISDLQATASPHLRAIFGMWIEGGVGTESYISNNSIFLNAASTAASFGTAGIWMVSNPPGMPYKIELNNNIVMNTSTPGTTSGKTVAIQRENAVLTNYALTSGNNALYAGTPAANRLIFYDGTNGDQTIQAFKARVSPREQSSFSEMVPFINSTVAPYDLHIQTTTPTQCESGGKPVSDVIHDYDGQSRYPNLGYPTSGFAIAPDVGADEFGGIMNDIASPSIEYVPLSSAAIATSRSIPTFATITDPSGVNGAPGTRPRLYYKRSTNTNTFNDNTNGTDGWKYVEASNGVSPFSFTIDYALLFGGAIVGGDIIQYTVVAQDLNSTPRVGINSGGFTSPPSSVALAGGNFPITNTINQYTIVTNIYSGVIPVGPTETVNSLTNAGGAFALLNAGALSGDVTLSITGNLTAETGQNTLNQWPEIGGSGYSVSIVPSAPINRLISGGSPSVPLIRMNGADRTIIDGRFAGAGRYLTFRETTSSSAVTITYINDAQNNILRNCIIEGSSPSTFGGVVVIGITSGNQGNDNNYIGYNEIRDRSDITATPAILLNCEGSNTTNLARHNHGNTIEYNEFHDWYRPNVPNQYAILVEQGNSNLTIIGNSFYQTQPRSHTVTGVTTGAIYIDEDGQGLTKGYVIIEDNFIGGSAPLASGADMTLASTAAQSFHGIWVEADLDSVSIQNNTIRKINFTTSAPTTQTTQFAGIHTRYGEFKIGTSTGNSVTDITANVNAGGTANSILSGISAYRTAGFVNVSIHNNTISNWTIGGTSTTATISYNAIHVEGLPTMPISIQNNLIGSTTLPNNIQFIAPAAIVEMTGIRTYISSGPDLLIHNNTIQNLTNFSTNLSSRLYGMSIESSSGALSPVTITNNLVQNLTENASPITTNPFTTSIGIAFIGYGGKTNVISGNTIGAMANLVTTSGSMGNIEALRLESTLAGGTISKNKIHGITNLQNGFAAGITGIHLASGDGWGIHNNMMSLTNGANTNALQVRGIVDRCLGNLQIYNNSIYIGGSTTGNLNSHCYVRETPSTLDLRNNLLYNDRTGSSSSHFAAGNRTASPGYGWHPGSSSYNAFVTRTSTKMGEWGIGTNRTFAQWKSSSVGDKESYADTTLNVPANILFANPTTANLSINTATDRCWYVNGKGIAGMASGSIADDFATTSIRSVTLGTPTDIGADEFTADPGVNPIPALASAAPALGTTTTYSFAGRKLGELVWASSGTVPASVTWNYFSSIPPTSAPGANINSHWDVAAAGGSGYAYDMISYYTLAEQNALPDPNLNLGKKTGASPWYYMAGTASVNTNGKLFTRLGLNTFSQFTLGTAAAANITITATVIAGTGTISPSGSVTVAPYNDQVFIITPSPCDSIDSVWVNGVYIGAVASYAFNTVIANHTITVKFKPVPVPSPGIVITANPGDTVCASTTVTFTATPANPGTNPVYHWKKNGLPTGTNSTTYTDNGLINGDIVTCSLTVAATCAVPNPAISNALTMVVYPITSPSIVITAFPGTAICTGFSVTFTASAANGGTSPIYDWRKNNLPVGANSTTYTDNGLLPGDVIVCILTTSEPCPTAPSVTSNALSITLAAPITAAPTADLRSCGFNTSCAGANDGTAHVNVTGGCPAYTFLWSNGDTTATISNLLAGTYSVTVTDGSGSTSVGTVTVTSPTALMAAITSQTASCANDSSGAIDIIASGGNNCSPYTFAWSNGAISEDLSGVPPGTYSVTVTDAAGCSTIQSASVASIPAPTPTFTQAGNTVVASQAWATYQWMLNGIPIVGATAISYTMIQSGTYTLMVTDNNGCEGTSNSVMIVGSEQSMGQLKNIFLFPNPARSEVRIGTIQPISYEISVRILDLFGRQLKYVCLSSLVQEIAIDIRLMPAGTYQVEITSSFGDRRLLRLVVQ